MVAVGERCFGVELADSGGGVGMSWGLLSTLKLGSILTRGEHAVVLFSSRETKPAGSSNACGKGDAM